jgi:hypothetical protein
VKTLDSRLTAKLASWVAGNNVKLNLTGSPERVQAIRESLVASRSFREELIREDATVDTVMRKLRRKHKAAKRFEDVLGISWPL